MKPVLFAALPVQWSIDPSTLTELAVNRNRNPRKKNTIQSSEEVQQGKIERYAADTFTALNIPKRTADKKTSALHIRLTRGRISHLPIVQFMVEPKPNYQPMDTMVHSKSIYFQENRKTGPSQTEISAPEFKQFLESAVHYAKVLAGRFG